MGVETIEVKAGRIEDYLTPAEAAGLKGVIFPTVYDAMRAGRLQAYRVLGHTALLKADVEAWKVRAKNGGSSSG